MVKDREPGKPGKFGKQAGAAPESAQPQEKPPRQVIFAHPSEEEFAKILDFYRIEWQYEPRSFPLPPEDGGALEMFTPDFYLH